MVGNPLVPPLGEVLNRALTPQEIAEFTAYLKPLAESGGGQQRSAVAYLTAAKELTVAVRSHGEHFAPCDAGDQTSCMGWLPRQARNFIRPVSRTGHPPREATHELILASLIPGRLS